MPWDRTKATNPKYRTREHADTRKRLMAELRRNGSGLCAEVVCVYRSRVITPDMKLHLCHDDSGLHIRGMGHAACNVKAAARKARRIQAQPVRYSRIW
jgi:hypothetical protein